MKISTSQFKNGLKIIISGQPCSIIEHEFHKPGKGQAVMRVKFRNLMTDKVIDRIMSRLMNKFESNLGAVIRQ